MAYLIRSYVLRVNALFPDQIDTRKNRDGAERFLSYRSAMLASSRGSSGNDAIEPRIDADETWIRRDL